MLLIALSLAFAVSLVSKRLNLPRVVAQILAGIILGLPGIREIVFDSESLASFKLFADIGLVLLFFFVGLETNLTSLSKNIRKSFLISLFNTLIPLTAGYVASRYIFGIGTMPSLVIGIALAVSSQSISLDFLEELRLLKSRLGKLIISSGMVADIGQLILVSGIIAVISASNSLAVQTVLLQGLMFAASLILIRYLVIPLILRLTDEKSRPLLFMSSVIIVLLTAGIAEQLGIGTIIGALFAGLILRQTLLAKHKKIWEEHQIAQAFHTTAFGFLVPLFFIWIGLNANMQLIAENLAMVIAFIIIAVGGTILGTLIGVLSSKGTVREGYLVGWGVTAKGDNELVIASLALQAGVITLGIFSGLIMMSMVTTLVSPVVFRLLVKRNIRRIA